MPDVSSNDSGAIPLWARIRLAWWIITDPRMTEHRVARTILNYHGQQEADDA